MNIALKFIFAVSASILTAVGIIIQLLSRNKYNDIMAAVDSKIFILKDFMPAGLFILDTLNLKNKFVIQKRRKIFFDYFGRESGEFYLYCAVACGLSSMVYVLPVGIFIGILSGEYAIIPIFLGAAGAIALYPGEEIRKRLKDRRRELGLQLPDVLARLSLLTGAGLVLRDALERTSGSAKGALYDELRKMLDDMNNGISDSDALHGLSSRCGTKEITHFASVLSQNLSGGGAGISGCLRYLNEEGWAERKNKAKISGQIASQKLMLPLMLMFIGVLAMIIIPLLAEI